MAVQINVAANQSALAKSIQQGVDAYNRRFAGSNQINLQINQKAFSQPLGRITGDVKDFNAAIAASNARVIAFGASTAVLGSVISGFKALANATIEVEKNLADINRILQLSTDNLQDYAEQLFDVAKSTSTSFDQASKALLEFSRQGLAAEETLKRTKDALILSRLAGMDAVDSVDALTATVNGFAATGITTSQVLNKLIAVEQSFAVSARDLSQGLSRTGQAAQEAGVSIDELNALITTAQQKTARGGAVIGNALKTIFTRLQRTETLDQLDRFNVAVRDIEGGILPATVILQNFANVYEKLADAQRAQLSEQVAGVYQVNILKALVSDLNSKQSIYNEALLEGASATNQAEIANAKLNQTLSALLQQTSTGLTELSSNIGKISFEPLAKYVVNIANETVETFNEILTGESIGSNFAKGLLKGIRNLIGGPGAIGAAYAFVGLIQNSFKYITQALPQIAGVTTETQNRKNIEQAVLQIMQQQGMISKALAGSMGDQTSQASILLNLAKQQTLEYQRQTALAQSLAVSLSRSGVGVGPAGLSLKSGRSGGFIPSLFAEQEKSGARKGGYSPGRVVPAPKNVGGIMNTAEDVKYVDGFKQPFINPPEKSRAGKIHRINALKQTGIDPYMAGGFIPNFATISISEKNISSGSFGVGMLNLSGRALKEKNRINSETKTGRKRTKEIISDNDVINTPKIEIEYYKGGDVRDLLEQKAQISKQLSDTTSAIEQKVRRASKRGKSSSGTIYGDQAAIDIIGPRELGEVRSGSYEPEKMRRKFARSAIENIDQENYTGFTTKIDSLKWKRGRYATLFAPDPDLLDDIQRGYKKKKSFSGFIPNFLNKNPRPKMLDGNKFEKDFFDKLGVSAPDNPQATLDLPMGVLGSIAADKKQKLKINDQSEYGDVKLAVNKDSLTSMASKYIRANNQHIIGDVAYTDTEYAILYQGEIDKKISAERQLSALVKKNKTVIKNVDSSLKDKNGKLTADGKKTKVKLTFFKDGVTIPPPTVASSGFIPNFVSMEEYLANRKNTNLFRGSGAQRNAAIKAGVDPNEIDQYLATRLRSKLASSAAPAQAPTAATSQTKPGGPQSYIRELVDWPEWQSVRDIAEKDWIKNNPNWDEGMRNHIVNKVETQKKRTKKPLSISELDVLRKKYAKQYILKNPGWRKMLDAAAANASGAAFEQFMLQKLMAEYPDLQTNVQAGLLGGPSAAIDAIDLKKQTMFEFKAELKPELRAVEAKFTRVFAENPSLDASLPWKNIFYQARDPNRAKTAKRANDYIPSGILGKAFSGFIPNFASIDRNFLRDLILLSHKNISKPLNKEGNWVGDSPLTRKLNVFRGVRTLNHKRWTDDIKQRRGVDINQLSGQILVDEIFNPKPAEGGKDAVKSTFVNSDVKDILRHHQVTSYNPNNLNYMPFVSASYDEKVAKEFAGGEGINKSKQMSLSRILNKKTLSALYKKYGKRKTKNYLFDLTQVGGGRGLGFDLNDILGESSNFAYEKEIPLLNKGFIPNFAKIDRNFLRDLILLNRENASKVLGEDASARIENNSRTPKLNVFRGVGGSSLRWHKLKIQYQKNDISQLPNQVLTDEAFSQRYIDERYAKGNFISGDLEDILTNHQTHSFTGDRPGYLPFVSTSYDEEIAKGFSGKLGIYKSKQIGLSRILTKKALSALYKKYGEKETKAKLFALTQVGGGRGLGFDVNDILAESSEFLEEKEIALLDKGFIPNFADPRYIRETLARIKAGTSGFSEAEQKQFLSKFGAVTDKNAISKKQVLLTKTLLGRKLNQDAVDYIMQTNLANLNADLRSGYLSGAVDFDVPRGYEFIANKGFVPNFANIKSKYGTATLGKTDPIDLELFSKLIGRKIKTSDIVSIEDLSTMGRGNAAGLYGDIASSKTMKGKGGIFGYTLAQDRAVDPKKAKTDKLARLKAKYPQIVKRLGLGGETYISGNYGKTAIRATTLKDLESNQDKILSMVDPAVLTLKKFSKGFIPNFAYKQAVMNFEEQMSGEDAIYSENPFPHVRNKSQPTFASAIADHGGLQNALADSIRNQSANRLLYGGIVPNFAPQVKPTDVFGPGTTITEAASAFPQEALKMTAANTALENLSTSVDKSVNELNKLRVQIVKNLNGLMGLEEIEKLIESADQERAKLQLESNRTKAESTRAEIEAAEKTRRTTIEHARQAAAVRTNTNSQQQNTVSQQKNTVAKDANTTVTNQNTEQNKGIKGLYKKFSGALEKARIGLAFAGPMLAGGLEQYFFGDKSRAELTPGQRSGKSLLSTGLTAVSTGVSIGGTAGGIVGAIVALTSAIGAMRLSVDELSENIKQTSSKQLEGVDKIKSLYDQYVEADRFGDETGKKLIQSEMRQVISSLPIEGGVKEEIDRILEGDLSNLKSGLDSLSLAIKESAFRRQSILSEKDFKLDGQGYFEKLNYTFDLKMSEAVDNVIDQLSRFASYLLGLPSGSKQVGGIIKAANGTYVNGSGVGDKYPALLENGEYVLNRNAVKALGGKNVLDALNFVGAPRFQSGGTIQDESGRIISNREIQSLLQPVYGNLNLTTQLTDVTDGIYLPGIGAPQSTGGNDSINDLTIVIKESTESTKSLTEEIRRARDFMLPSSGYTPNLMNRLGGGGSSSPEQFGLPSNPQRKYRYGIGKVSDEAVRKLAEQFLEKGGESALKSFEAFTTKLTRPEDLKKVEKIFKEISRLPLESDRKEYYKQLLQIMKEAEMDSRDSDAILAILEENASAGNVAGQKFIYNLIDVVRDVRKIFDTYANKINSFLKNVETGVVPNLESVYREISKFRDLIGVSEIISQAQSQRRNLNLGASLKRNTDFGDPFSSLGLNFESEVTGARERRQAVERSQLQAYLQEVDNLVEKNTFLSGQIYSQMQELNKKGATAAERWQSLREYISKIDAKERKGFTDRINAAERVLDLSELELEESVKTAQTRRDIEKEILLNQTSFTYQFQSSISSMSREADVAAAKIAYDAPRLFAEGMTTALMEVAKGTKSIGDAFRDVAIDFGYQLMQQAIGALNQKLISGIFGQGSSLLGLQSGGAIRANNGLYVNGSGSGDRYPAMLENGEYVLNRNAVKMMGGKNVLDKLNFQNAPRFAAGGGFFTSAGYDTKKDDYTGDLLLNGRSAGKIDPDLYTARAFEEDPYFIKQKEKAVKKFQERVQKRFQNKMARAQLVSSAVGALGAMFVSAGLSQLASTTANAASQSASAASNRELIAAEYGNQADFKIRALTRGDISPSEFNSFVKANPSQFRLLDPKTGAYNILSSGSRISNKALISAFSGVNSYLSQNQRSGGRQIGGYIGFNSGGFVPYGSRLNDTIPALLTGGEYVMNNSAVKKYGLGTMNSMNAGSYQSGGMASNSATTNNNTNNNATNISINVDRSGKAVYGADTSSYKQNDIQISKQMARQINAIVLKTMVNEKRYGGELYKDPLRS